jgi:MOSC domain-containing protein YiiM
MKAVTQASVDSVHRVMDHAPMTDPCVVSIHVGKVAPLGPDGIPSGFVKHRVSSVVTVAPLGIIGDEQADLTVHGGADKAVYAYARAHYAAWRREYPQHADLLVAGGLGENLAIDGMTEADICVGDVHAIGSARLQVCQPRQPCFKFALRFNDTLMPKAMIRNGRSGWYYRVINAGILSPDDRVVLLERPNPNFPLTRLVELITHHNATMTEWQQMSHMAGLAMDLQRRASDIVRRHGRGRVAE